MSEDLALKIKNQVEFYFSGLNLKRDKFMREKMSSDPEGFMLIETLLTFNRLKQLTTDAKVVVDAIKDSDKLSFNAEYTKVKSNIDFLKPENNVSDRTVHLRGFPTSATLDDLLEGLKPFGNIRFIEMRRFVNTKGFKGSINVEFNSPKEAEDFLKKTISFAGVIITDKELLSDHEKKQEENHRRYTYCQDSIVQVKGVGESTTEEKIQEVFKPYLGDHCYLYRDRDYVTIRFLTSADAAKCIEGLKGVALVEKPMKMTLLHGKKASSIWSKIKALLLKEENGRESEKRGHEEEGIEKRVKVE